MTMTMPRIVASTVAPDAVPAPSRGIALTASNLRAWGGKSAYSLIDQGLTSLTGFFVSFLLARWLSAEVFGAYSIAFAACLFISGFHTVILLEPISVFGPARHVARLPEYFRAQAINHILLTAALSAVALLAAGILWRVAPLNPLVGAIFGSALALPFLLFLWLTRRMCYVVHSPRIAILGSGSCLAFALAGLYALRHLDWLNPFSSFLLVGAASLLGSCAILVPLRKLTAASQPIASRSNGSAPPTPSTWRTTAKENWSYGRWLVGGTALYSISSQVQIFLAAAFLGLGSAGILRAMMLPGAVMTQAVSAADMLVLPRFSHDFGRGALAHLRQKAILVSVALGTAGLIFAALLWTVAAPLEYVLFRGKFAAFAWLMPLLALIPAANGFAGGFSAALRGSQLPHTTLIASAVSAPVSVLTAFCFIRWRGLVGAVISMVAGLVCYMFANAWFFFARSAENASAAQAVARRA
jgi:O-antigen/teichoic acid export membrane protein